MFLSFSIFVFAQDKTETDDPSTNYKTAFALVNANKANEAIPYLEKVVKTTSAYTAAAYSLLGSIYDNDHQPEKAIATYKEGLKAYPKDQSMHYNLGLAFFRNKQYADAETEAVEAIKLDPKHTNSQRMYALVTFHQNKRVNALLGFCSFLLLEPNTPRSAEAFTNIQSILKGGALKEDGINPAKISPKEETDIKLLNMCIQVAVTNAQKQKLAGADLLEEELKSIFVTADKIIEKPEKDFFDKFYADYFFKLSQSGNMSSFAKMVSEHTPLSGALGSWVKSTERGF